MPKSTTNTTTTVSEMFRQHFEPETLVSLIAYLQTADSYRPHIRQPFQLQPAAEWILRQLRRFLRKHYILPFAPTEPL